MHSPPRILVGSQLLPALAGTCSPDEAGPRESEDRFASGCPPCSLPLGRPLGPDQLVVSVAVCPSTMPRVQLTGDVCAGLASSGGARCGIARGTHAPMVHRRVSPLTQL